MINIMSRNTTSVDLQDAIVSDVPSTKHAFIHVRANVINNETQAAAHSVCRIHAVLTENKDMERNDMYWHIEGRGTKKVSEEERRIMLRRKRRQRNKRLQQHLSGEYLQEDDGCSLYGMIRP